MKRTVTLKEAKLRQIIFETVKRVLTESNEFVSTMDFHYKGKNLSSVGDGDSFCYLPCDIYGTPKLYYGDCHYYCASVAIDDIAASFGISNIMRIFDEYKIDSITEDLWLNCISEPGRLFYGKYIVVGFDGHIPSCEYVKGVIEYMGGSPRDYYVLYNNGNSVEEINCADFLKSGLSKRQKPNILPVPEELKVFYDNIQSRQSIANKKFPQNMTRAEYYWYTRQE